MDIQYPAKNRGGQEVEALHAGQRPIGWMVGWKRRSLSIVWTAQHSGSSAWQRD